MFHFWDGPETCSSHFYVDFGTLEDLGVYIQNSKENSQMTVGYWIHLTIDK